MLCGWHTIQAEDALPFGAIARYTVSDKPNMTHVLFLGDGKRLAASDLDHVVVWDLVSGKTLADLGGAEIKAASPDGNVVVSRSGHYMQLLNVGANPPTRIPSDPSDAEGAAFSPSGTLATTTLTCDVIFWKPADQWAIAKKTKLQTNRGNGTEGIAFSPDGKMLAVQIAGNFSLLDPATGNKLYEEPDSKLFGHFNFSPDGATLAIADPPYTGKPLIHLWDVATKKLRGSCPIEFGVHHLSYLPDGSAIVYRGGTLNGIQGAIRICDSETGALYASLDISDSEFSSVAVSPDGRTLAAGNDKSIVYLWDIGKLILKSERIPDEFKPADLDALWLAMAGKDAAAGYRAAWKMGCSGNAGVHFLKTRLKMSSKNQAHVDKLIEALDNENAGIRTAARNDLTALGDQVEPDLRKVSDGPQTPHAKSEAKAILTLM